jgi:hypothetical protein
VVNFTRTIFTFFSRLQSIGKGLRVARMPVPKFVRASSDDQDPVSVFGQGDSRFSTWVLRFLTWMPAISTWLERDFMKLYINGVCTKKEFFFSHTQTFSKQTQQTFSRPCSSGWETARLSQFWRSSACLKKGG